MENDPIIETREALSDLYEAHSPRERFSVSQALDAGDRSDILASIEEVNQAEYDFIEAVAALGATPQEAQGLVDRLKQEADAIRAALALRLQEEVAKDTGMNVWPAIDGMAYQGAVVDRDDIFQYQQVAPKTLIAHDIDKDLDTPQKGLGLAIGSVQDQEQGLERGIGR